MARTWEQLVQSCLSNSDVNENGCWITRYSTRHNGYASVSYTLDKKYILQAHRIVLADKLGYGFEDYKTFCEVAMHKCNVRECVNPSHLEPGDYKDNAAYMVKQGRHQIEYKPTKDPDSPLLVKELTDSAIEDIILSRGKMSRLDIAEKHGVDINAVSRIQNGKAHKHIYNRLVKDKESYLKIGNPTRRRSLEEIIEICSTKYNVTDKGCWETTLGKQHKYGIISYTDRNGRKKILYAHRIVLMQKMGVSFSEYETFCEAAMHICDNPPCVNPEHLKPGTKEENFRDMFDKGRFRGHNKGKISEAETASIIRSDEKITDAELANVYGLCKLHIWRIRTGRARKSVHKKIAEGKI